VRKAQSEVGNGDVIQWLSCWDEDRFGFVRPLKSFNAYTLGFSRQFKLLECLRHSDSCKLGNRFKKWQP